MSQGLKANTEKQLSSCNMMLILSPGRPGKFNSFGGGGVLLRRQNTNKLPGGFEYHF